MIVMNGLLLNDWAEKISKNEPVAAFARAWSIAPCGQACWPAARSVENRQWFKRLNFEPADGGSAFRRHTPALQSLRSLLHSHSQAQPRQLDSSPQVVRVSKIAGVHRVPAPRLIVLLGTLAP